ncbi:WAP four-disulfide core domain protein 10A [Sigmodon hispidus]
MSSRTLLLILALLLLPSLSQGGFLRKRIYEVKEGQPPIKACEKKPKLHLCNYHCEEHRNCQANNICCSTSCGNVCVNLLDDSVWEAPMENPKEMPFSPIMFGADMITLSSPFPTSS